MSRPYADADVFRAIADPTRRKIIDLLRKGPMHASEIHEAIPRSPGTLSAHLRTLRSTRVIEQRRQGKFRLYRLRPQTLERAYRWLGQGHELNVSRAS